MANRRAAWEAEYPWVVVESSHFGNRFGSFDMRIEHRFRDESGASSFAASKGTRCVVVGPK